MPLLAQPFASRAIISEDLEGLSVFIPAKWSWALLFPAAWLCGWTLGGVVAGASLFHHFSFFVCFWMVGWAIGEIVVGYIVLYAIAGREIIQVGADTLTRQTQIFRVSIITKSYRVAEMRNLRFQADASSSKTRIPSRIAFDYEGKVSGFGAGLAESEAIEVIARIQQRCPIAATASQESGIKFWGH